MNVVERVKSKLTIALDDSEDEEEAQLTVIDYDVPVGPDHLRHWLRRAKRKFRNGIYVIKVGHTGKLLKRTVFIGLKPQYLEITSRKFFDIGYHVSEVATVEMGLNSVAFEQLAKNLTTGVRMPKAEKTCVVRVGSVDVSLIFEYEGDRRDFMFLLCVEMRAAETRYGLVKERFEVHQAV